MNTFEKHQTLSELVDMRLPVFIGDDEYKKFGYSTRAGFIRGVERYVSSHKLPLQVMTTGNSKGYQLERRP